MILIDIFIDLIDNRYNNYAYVILITPARQFEQ